jgi:hypothetical protein
LSLKLYHVCDLRLSYQQSMTEAPSEGERVAGTLPDSRRNAQSNWRVVSRNVQKRDQRRTPRFRGMGFYHRYKVPADNVCPGEALLHTRNTLGQSRRAFSSDE